MGVCRILKLTKSDRIDARGMCDHLARTEAIRAGAASMQFRVDGIRY